MTTTPYGTEFFLDQSDGSLAGAFEVLPVVFGIARPESVLDVGCGVGTWLAAARQHGVSDVVGVDGPYVRRDMLKIDPQNFLDRDLRQPFDLGRRFDLVVSLEVAEHLPESAADTFIDNLVRHGSMVLFSAAVPGQGGTWHLNEQWPGFWAEKFRARGFSMIDCVRQRIWNNQRIPVCYRQNTFLYVEDKILEKLPTALQAVGAQARLPEAVVHPDLFAEVMRRPIGTRRLLKEMLPAFRRTIYVKSRRLMGLESTSAPD